MVCIVHGFGEHSERYEWVGTQLAAAGYAVRACDLRGHGRSPGRRAYVKSFGEYLRDVDALVTWAREEHPRKKLFVLGHSMGGGVAALHAVTRPGAADGYVLSGAAATKEAEGWRAKLFGVLARVAPRVRLGRLKADAISRDPEVVEAYKTDPLVYRGRMYLGLVGAAMRAAHRITDGAQWCEAPVLILHGEADSLVDASASEALYERWGFEDKTLKVYPGLYHEILNEPEREEVLAEIVEWLDARV